MAAIEISAEFAAEIVQYSPSEAVCRELGRKVMVPIVGPTAVGKSTLMEQICELEPASFHRVQSFTTRDQRLGEPDDAYRFLKHTQATLDTLQTKVENGELVQIARHSKTGYLYGSELLDYPATYNVLDTLSTEVDTLRQLPFGYSTAIALTTDPESWTEWFMARYRHDPDVNDAEKRLDEAYQSLQWSRDDRDIMWAMNYPHDKQQGAKEIIAMAQGGTGSNRGARAAGVLMQNTIPTLRDMIMELAA
jgi:guanylate kinase